jgi:hypothetical protein
LLDTVFIGNASNTWRAIEYGIELLKIEKGIIWRVGNGKNIRIWRDNWIPRDFYLRPIKRRRPSRLKWVADLIDEERMEWKIDILQQIFAPADVEVILKIKFSYRTEDIIAWHFERSGIFSVKSAYKLALNLSTLDTHASSSENKNRRCLWQHILKADIPPKVKIFARRLARNALPTNVNKKARNILKDDTCHICGMESESSYHAVVACPHSRALSEAMRTDWPVPHDSQFQLSGPDWFLLLLDRLSKEERSAMILIFWRNWSDRNSVTHGGRCLSIKASAHALRGLQTTLLQIQHNISDDMKGKRPLNIFAGNQKQEVPKEKQTAKLLWQPPEKRWIKINVDGSYVERTGQASAGVLIRDHNGHVLVSAWRYLFHCSSAEEAEIFSCREGLLLAHHWCNGPVILESDCSSCLAALSKQGINCSIHASLVQDVKMIMTMLENVHLVKVPREQYRVAYELAQHARRVCSSAVWLGRVPSCIEHVVLQDCNVT